MRRWWPGPRARWEWPGVLVRAFDGDAAFDEQRVLLREYLAAELGRPREVRVLLDRDGQGKEPFRPPTTRFELRGRLRREGGRFVITARLVDGVSGEQVWGEEFPAVPPAGQEGDRAGLEEVARLVAARVGAENGVMVQALMDEHRRSPVPGAYGAILQTYNFFFTRDVSLLAPAIEAVRRVVAEAPENSLAWLLLARLYQVNFTFELAELNPIDQSVVFAGLALRLDPPSARVRSILAASLLVKGELELGRDALDQALRLNPGSLTYQEIVGWLLALLGDWERGVGLMQEAMARNAYHLPHVYHGLSAKSPPAWGPRGSLPGRPRVP